MRLDIELTISFMCTRVSRSTEEDWDKLAKLLGYLNGTIDMVMTISAETLKEMKSWTDISYAIHNDKRSHRRDYIIWERGYQCNVLKVKVEH